VRTKAALAVAVLLVAGLEVVVGVGAMMGKLVEGGVV